MCGITEYVMSVLEVSEDEAEALIEEQVEMIRNGETTPDQACYDLGIECDFEMELIERAAF